MGQPGLGGQSLRLIGADLVGMAQGQAYVVKAVEQAVLAKGVDLEGDFLALSLDNALALEIDGQLETGKGGHFAEQAVDHRFG